MTERLCGWMLAAALLFHGAHAAEVRSLEVERDGRRYHVASSAFIEAPVAAVYGILSDYDRFQEISSVFEESGYLPAESDETTLVYTRARGCVLFFCRTIERVEQLELMPENEIFARVIPERSDVPFGEARWELTPEQGGTRVDYRLAMELGVWVPPMIGPLVIRGKLRRSGLRAAERLEQLAIEASARVADAP